MFVEAIVSEDGKILTQKIFGKLDISIFTEFNNSYQDKIDSVSKVILDFKKVEYVDSSGLGILLVLRERSGGDDADIDIINISPGVRKILETTKFQLLFNMK